MAAKHFIAGMHLKKGAFTAKAKAHGETVPEYAREVLAKGSHASTTTKRQANAAQMLRRLPRHHGPRS